MPGSALTRSFHSSWKAAKHSMIASAFCCQLFTGPWPGMVGEHVRPVGELAPILEREVEEGGQRHGRQLLRHQVDPVERLADRQGVEDLAGALAHHRGHVGDVGRRDRRADRLAVDAVLGLVHGDEAGAAAAARLRPIAASAFSCSSIALRFGRPMPSAEEKASWSVSTAMMSSQRVIDQ